MKDGKTKMGRRGLLGSFATVGGSLLLGSLATGIPTRVLLNPLTASADDTPTGKLLILSSSRQGDPFNANVPGTYEYGPNEIFHSADPAMAKTALTLGRSEADSTLVGGYYYSAPFRDLLASGQLNPWLLPGQSQTPEALRALEAASATGAKLVGGETTLTQFDATVSSEIWQLPAGGVGFAAGLDWRKETYEFIVTNSSGNVIGDIPSDTPQPKVDRTVTAFYAELAVPIFTRHGLWGVLNLDAARINAYPPKIVQVVEVVAQQLGFAVEHAMLLDQIQDALAALNEAQTWQTELLGDLRHAQAELLRASRVATAGVLAAGVAHEFNNLLASMHGYAELGQGGTQLDKDEAFEMIRRTCQRGTPRR